MSPRLSGVFTEVDRHSVANPTLSFLKDYWDRKRGSRAMPSRADINPADMKQHLGWLVMVDALPDFSHFRYRSIGTRVTTYFAPNATGKTIREAFTGHEPAVLNGLIAPYRKAARDKVVVHAWGAADWLGRAFLDFNSLYLPLSDDGVTANKVLSAVIFELASPLKRG